MRYILTISLPDAQGLIAKVASILTKSHLNIEKNSEHVDLEHHYFFMRTEFSGECDLQALLTEFQSTLGTQAQIRITKQKKRPIIILCSKENHCLGDLLLKNESGELNATIQAIISNHQILKSLSEKFEIPFYYVNTNQNTHEEHEQQVLEIAQSYNPDFLVLAKYMRILSPSFVNRYYHRILNIHHSFLPAFIGANPYKQAHERGVKIIGATAHFVNEDLDEGPIIVQDTIPIDHSYDWQEMQKAGKDVEKVVLARALDLVLQDRVFIFKNKTIIF